MNTTRISNKNIFLLILMASIPFFPSGVSSSIILILLATFIINKPFIDRRVVHFLRPLTILVFIGVIMGLGSLFNGNSYMFFKDIYYFIQPILIILLGYYVASVEINAKKLFKLIVYGALVVTLYIYTPVLVSALIGGEIGLVQRYEYNLESGMPLIGFMVVYISKISNFQLFKLRYEAGLLVFFLLAVIVSFSRVDIVLLLAIILTPVLVKALGVRVQLILISMVIIILSFFGSMIQVDTPDEEPSNFTEKVINSYSEAIVRNLEHAGDPNSASNINNYWRAQEAYLGVSKYLEGSDYQLIFGQGMGSFVSGSDYFNDKLQKIPFFHNGYVTIILKTGWIGLLLFFLFIYSISRFNYIKSSSKDVEVIFFKFLSIVVIYSIVFKTWFVMGIYSAEPIYYILFLIGILFKFQFMKSHSKS